jgi:hypothetical protein
MEYYDDDDDDDDDMEHQLSSVLSHQNQDVWYP